MTSSFCDQCDQDGLIAYLDGALGNELTKAIERHVEGCAICRERLSGLSRTFECASLATIPEPNALWSSRFSYTVRRGIALRASTRHRRRRVVTFFGLGFTVLASVVIFLGAPGQRQDSDKNEFRAYEGRALEGISSMDSNQPVDFADLVGDYWIDTASTEELLLELGTVEPGEFLALVEDN